MYEDTSDLPTNLDIHHIFINLMMEITDETCYVMDPDTMYVT
jgi:hypothetical protein